VDPGLLAFEAEVFGEVATQKGLDPTQHFAGRPQERGVANWEWVQALLRAVDASPYGANVLEQVTRDVYYYLHYPAVGRKIDEIVRAEFGDGPCVVVGHSLGSVVGYKVLCNAIASQEVRKYVTVGSPLGVRAIQRKVAPLMRPACVRDWYNAMDERDVVALRPLDKDVFPVAPPIRNKTSVDNHTENRHGIVGYLDDPDVAREVLDALN
jgi:pimeloyl-ACP methyl ester carboxylesterase